MPREPRSFRLHELAGAQFLRVPGGRNCHRGCSRRLRIAAPPARQTPGSSSKAVGDRILRIGPAEQVPSCAAVCGSGMPLASVTSSRTPQGKARVVWEYLA